MNTEPTEIVEPKRKGSPNYCGCGKRISENKKACFTCKEAAQAKAA